MNNTSSGDERGEPEQPTATTESVLREFLVTDLKIEDRVESQIRFDRVHRLGARKRHSRSPRPIVVKFERYTEREIVRKAGMELNSNPDTKMKVREQFPREIKERHKFLYPVMYRIKNKNPNARVNLVRDKLYVNGQLYSPEDDPEYRLPRADANRRAYRGTTQFQRSYQSPAQFQQPGPSPSPPPFPRIPNPSEHEPN